MRNEAQPIALIAARVQTNVDDLNPIVRGIAVDPLVGLKERRTKQIAIALCDRFRQSNREFEILALEAKIGLEAAFDLFGAVACWFPRGTEPVFPPRSEPPLSMVF